MSKVTKDLRELSIDELATRRRDLKEETLHLRVQQESGQLENSARLREIRRGVSRIETILSERKLATANEVTQAPAAVEKKKAKKAKKAPEETEEAKEAVAAEK